MVHPPTHGSYLLIFVDLLQFLLDSHVFLDTPTLVVPTNMNDARREGFAHEELHVERKAQIEAAKDAQLVGIPNVMGEDSVKIDGGVDGG